MGYTCGRKHTEESLRKIAKEYNTKSEFQKKDKGAYSSARKRGSIFLKSICEHMINGAYSTPQLICKKIMEELLGIECDYNTKKIITPYELDIYFPEFKLAIEYNGKGWHKSEESIKRDNNKKILCTEKEITLIYIIENSRDYEKDIKTQIISHLKIINKVTNNNFNESDINQIVCLNIYEDILKTRDINEIKTKIKKCSSIVEFQQKYISEYNFLRKNKKLELLNQIRINEQFSEEKLLENCRKISNYSDLLKNHTNIYHTCQRKGLLEKATAHMHKTNKFYRNYSDEDLLNLANKFKMKSYVKKENTPLYRELIRRDILKLVTYDPNFTYKPHKKLLKELAVKQCFEDSEKYNNYLDFKNDKDLYERCSKYKIIKKITEKFIKPNINETILEESKKYKNFEEFTKSIWYLKSKRTLGLIQKVKKQNNWSYRSKEKINYIKKYPNIVKMVNDNIKINQIFKITKIDKTTIWRIKQQMHNTGILKIDYKSTKRINN